MIYLYMNMFPNVGTPYMASAYGMPIFLSLTIGTIPGIIETVFKNLYMKGQGIYRHEKVIHST